MIGLGVGIDYALFLVTKHQEQLGDGLELRESIARAVASSGSAIVFAGGTVVIALVSLAVAGIPLVSTLGFASAIAVLCGRAHVDHPAAGDPVAAWAGGVAALPDPGVPEAEAPPGGTAALGRLGPGGGAAPLDRDGPVARDPRSR